MCKDKPATLPPAKETTMHRAVHGIAPRPVEPPPIVPVIWSARPAPCDPDHRFVQILQALRPFGGLGRMDEVCARAARQGCNHSRVRTWLACRQVFSIDWSHHSWLPLFQLDPESYTPWPVLACVLQELGSMYDPWELADWFATPNGALDEACPATVLHERPASVREAARMLRYAAMSQ